MLPQTIGALTVLRTDVHHFSAEEESLVSAFADLMSTAIGVPREELAGAARDQVAATRAMIDAQAGRDATAAEKDQVAARLTQPIGDSLATYAARSVS